MDRRTFLKTSTAAAAATTAAAGAAKAQETFQDLPRADAEIRTRTTAVVPRRHEFRLALPHSPTRSDAAHCLAREIEIASGGRLVFHLQELPVSGAGLFETGKIDAAFGNIGEICAAPELALFSGLPGDLALSPDQLLAWHDAAAGDMFLDAAADEYGLTAMVAGHSGAATGLWSNRELTDLRDLAGAHVDTLGLGRRIVDHIRAAHDYPPHNSRSARLADTAVAPLDALRDLPETSRRIWYRDGLHTQGHADMLIIDRRRWSDLSDGDRTLIRRLANSAAHRSLSAAKAAGRLVAPSIFASQPLSRLPLPADIDLALRFTARQVVDAEFARQTRITPAFTAYSAFFQSMTGVPLPSPANIA